ncbi:ArsR/SmtB family transcription factor, partial [Protofrankia symbiont of Coriaria ruscifolia]|uniref:ArsR/SmtB family transcription factor n=1 Tax=Protofrankia symbiont of Coriaria ruscifolia TaxID=1306542 RepID=UPI001041A41A
MASQIFEALANPIRCDLVERLRESDATVGELAKWYKADVQAVCEHLKVLEQAGLVSRSGEAHRSPVHLNAEVFDLMTEWIERFRRQVERRYQDPEAVLAPMKDTATDDSTNDILVRKVDLTVRARPSKGSGDRTRDAEGS